MDHEKTDASARRIATRALILLVPLLVLAVAAPRLLALARQYGGGAAPAPAPRDRPPTPEEIRASAEADERLAALEREGLSGSATITPEGAAVDARGERVRRFQGFGVSVDSAPPGAWVRAGGQELGTTPLVAGLPCTPGAEVVLEIGAPGLTTARRTVRCREDALVELSVRLAR